MNDATLYDEDILLWSERQAEVIRRLRETVRGLPNDLDIENVAEEIESVGRSELAAVESCMQLILLHAIKLVVEADDTPVGHWRGEIVGFHSNLKRRYAPSMRQRIDMDEIWSDAREQLMPGYGTSEMEILLRLPKKCPIVLDELVGRRIDVDGLIERVKGSPASAGAAR